MATPRRDTADISAKVPVETVVQDYMSHADTSSSQSIIKSDNVITPPVELIQRYVDAIHAATLLMESSDELADVLLKAQMLRSSVEGYIEGLAHRVVDADTNINE